MTTNFNPYDSPEYCEQERLGEQQYEARELAAADNGGWHHPDCQCDACYYGADAAKWLYNPSEY